jgi:hypothetical protein
MIWDKEYSDNKENNAQHMQQHESQKLKKKTEDSNQSNRGIADSNPAQGINTYQQF